MKPGNILIFIVIILIFTPFLIHSNSHGWGGDFALYINQAQALWEGNTQQLLEQNSFGLKHSSYSYYSPVLYPWGWPLLLSPVIKFAGLNFVVLKMVVLYFFIGTVISVYYLFRYKAGSTGSLLIAVYIAFNPGLIEYTNVLRSAFPFLFFTMLSFIMYESMNKSKDIGWSKIIPAAFFFFFASIIRSEGFLLVVAVGIAEFIKWGFQKYSKKYLANRMWLFKMATVFILFHVAYVMILPGGTASNFKHFKLTTVDTAIDNISFYFNHLDYCFSSFLKQSFVIVMLPFVLLGLYSRFRDDMAIAVYFVLLHLLFIIWPHHEIRYLFIIAPFYFYFLFQGIKKINFSIKLLGKSFSGNHLIFSALLLVLLLDFGFYLIRKSKAISVTEGPVTEDARKMFSFVKNNTSKEDVIVFFKPRVMSLFTNRRSCIINDNTGHLQQTGNYVVLHKNMGNYNQIISVIDNTPDWLHKIFENNRFLIYQIKTKTYP